MYIQHEAQKVIGTIKNKRSQISERLGDIIEMVDRQDMGVVEARKGK